MKIWEDDNQKYIKAMMEKNTTEQNEKLTKRLEEIDFSVLEHKLSMSAVYLLR